MRSNPQLTAKTKEIWARVRRPESATSEIQALITALRTRVSGIVAYQTWLEGVGSWDAYGSGLESRATDRAGVDSDDTQTARSIVEDAFTSFDDFSGDSTNDTGVFGLSGYDGYRTYLTDNGVGEIDSDEHAQTIQAIFDPDDTFIDAVEDDLTSWSELDTWLQDNGFSANEADEFVTRLQTQFDSWTDFETFLSGAVSLDPLLNEFGHSLGPSGGQPGVEVRDGELYLYGDEIHLQKRQADGDLDPDPADTVSWTMQTTNQSVDIGDVVTIEATGSTSSSESFAVEVPLIVDGDVDDRKVVSVANGEATVRFWVELNQPGSYDVQIGDSSPITVTVNW
jgi:hypothetical protein